MITSRTAVAAALATLFLGACSAPPSTPTTVATAATSAGGESPASPGSASPAASSVGTVGDGTLTVDGAAAAAGTAIGPGAAVAGDGTVTVGATRVVLAKAAVTIGADKVLSLTKGAVRIADDQDSLVVTTPTLRVAPQGTGFAVGLSTAASVVVVSAGSVEVTGVGNEPVQLIGGEALTVPASGNPTLSSAASVKDATLVPKPIPAAKGDSTMRTLRVEGRYLMGIKITSTTTKQVKVGDSLKRYWHYTPGCASGACEVTIKRELITFTCKTADGCGTKPLYNAGTLPFADGEYSGFVLSGKTSCGSAQGGSRKTKGVLAVSDAVFEKGSWVATKLTGTLDDTSSSFQTCAAFHTVSQLTGVRK